MKIKVKDYSFVLGYDKMVGFVLQNSEYTFISDADGDILCYLPYRIQDKDYGKVISVPVYLNSNLVSYPIMKGVDVYSKYVNDKYQLDLCGSYKKSLDVCEEYKLKLVPYMLFLVCLILVSILTILISFFFKFGILYKFIFSAIFVVLCLIYSDFKKVLDANIFYDMNGNWVDFDKDTTSLMNGYYIPGRGENA